MCESEEKKSNQNNPAQTHHIPIPTPISHPRPSPTSALFAAEPVYTGEGGDEEVVDGTENIEVEVEVDVDEDAEIRDDDVANVDGDENDGLGLAM